MTSSRWLTGWKQIADHFQVSVSTAQRWAIKRGMPVVRDGGTVSTQAQVLDKWRWECQSASNNVRECNTPK